MPGAALNKVPHAAKGVSADAVCRMDRSLGEKFVFIHQLQSRKHVVSLMEDQRGFEQMAVQGRAGRQLVHPAPDHGRGPVARSQGPVVLHRRGLPPLASRFQRLGMLQASNAVLHGPIARGCDAGPPRPRVEWSQVDAPAFFVWLAPVERASLQSYPVEHEPRRDYAETGVGGILQVMTEGRERQFRRGIAMQVRHRPQRRLRRRTAIELPGNSLRQRQRVERSQLGKYVVRMLMIYQRLAVIGFARLKELRE